MSDPSTLHTFQVFWLIAVVFGFLINPWLGLILLVPAIFSWFGPKKGVKPAAPQSAPPPGIQPEINPLPQGVVTPPGGFSGATVLGAAALGYWAGHHTETPPAHNPEHETENPEDAWEEGYEEGVEAAGQEWDDTNEQDVEGSDGFEDEEDFE